MAKRASPAHQFKVFLSHRYKAPAANLYFWSILSQAADVQFEVDPAFSVLEGGYNPQRLAESVAVHLEVLLKG